MSVEDRLRSLRAPEEEAAQRRAWELAAAARAARDAEADAGGRADAPRRRVFARPALVATALAAVLVAAVTPPGSAVADWVGDAVRSVVGDDGPPKRAKSLDRLPGGGRVLVLTADSDAWIAGDGAHRRIARGVDVATWSPQGRFAALATADELFAVDPQGRRRWSIPAHPPVQAMAWSPDGFRVAYTNGNEVRLVAGDGTGDRRVAFRAERSRLAFTDALAWKPGPGHVLAFADGRTLFLADTDRRQVLWQKRLRATQWLAFSPTGDRLLVIRRRDVRILDTSNGDTLQRLRRPPYADELYDPAWDHSGRSFALVRYRPGRGTEVLVGRPRGRTIRLRRLFVGSDLGLAGYSPDNRWLLVHWSENDSWLFLPLTGGRPRQVTGVRRRFGGARLNHLEWCCAP